VNQVTRAPKRAAPIEKAPGFSLGLFAEEILPGSENLLMTAFCFVQVQPLNGHL
jgi:hypothetical protein